MLSIMLYNSWAMMGLLDWGRATAYRYRDCMAEEAVEGMPRAGAGTWIRVGVAMGAG
ncbi:MAG: hypothetical protein ACP5HT_06045 [Conexivisphaera sp.]